MSIAQKQDNYLGEKTKQVLLALIPVPSIYMAPKPNLIGKPMHIWTNNSTQPRIEIYICLNWCTLYYSAAINTTDASIVPAEPLWPADTD